MRLRKYKCPNGCELPPRRKNIRKLDNDSYGYGYIDFLYCPHCGALMPETLEKVQAFFDVYHIHPKLNTAKRLILKSEFESAAREAFVIVEAYLKEKSGLDLHGKELVIKALKFDYNKQTGQIHPPLIAINKLQSESERNEQEGIMLMLMGFFQGLRNIYQHNQIGSQVSNSIFVVLEASFFLNLFDGHSITKKGKWIPVKYDCNSILKKTPKFTDRIFIYLKLKKII